MALKWKVEDLKPLIAHVQQSKEHFDLYGEVTGPGLWLVGDQGVYLMSNGKPALMGDGTTATSAPVGKARFVAYAEGCHPDKDADFYERKRREFGGDDGVDFVSIDILEKAIAAKAEFLVVTIRSNKISFELVAPQPPSRKAKAEGEGAQLH